MMISVLFFSLACSSNEPGRPQSKPVAAKPAAAGPETAQVTFGAGSNPEEGYVEDAEMLAVFPELTALPDLARSAVIGSVNLVPAPCEPCWDDETTLGACAVQQLQGCENIATLVRRAIGIGEALKDPTVEYRRIIEALSYADVWIPDDTAVHTPAVVDVEVWIDPDDPGAAKTLDRIAELRAAETPAVMFHIRAFGEGDAAKTLAGAADKDAWLRGYVSGKDAGGVAGSLDLDVIRTKKVRNTPTWFIEGYRLRGLQSVRSITHLIEKEAEDGATPHP
ncbi:MAG: hypothetical protein AAFV53_27545 [Myxococcota bacterium]